MIWKELKKELCSLEQQKSYIKFEIKHLHHELMYAREEIKRIQSVPLILGQFVEMVDAQYAVVNATNDQFYVRVLSILNREKLFADCSIGLPKHSHSIVEILPPEAD